jgi:hypothetical protein
LTESEGKQRIDAAVAALVAGAPGTLDTLKELADALGGDRNFSATVMSMLAGKLGKTEQAADAEKLGGKPPEWFATYDSLALPFAALPYLTVATGNNRIAVTVAVSAGQGGTVSVPAGVLVSIGQEVTAGQTGCMRSFTTQAWTAALAINSTCFLRAKVQNGALAFYVQRGTDTDPTPASLKGTPDGLSGGGFDSTCI